MENEKRLDLILERKAWSVEYKDGRKKKYLTVVADNEDVARYTVVARYPELAEKELTVTESTKAPTVLSSTIDTVNAMRPFLQELDYNKVASMGILPGSPVVEGEFDGPALQKQIVFSAQALLQSLPREDRESDRINTRTAISIGTFALECMVGHMMKGADGEAPSPEEVWENILTVVRATSGADNNGEEKES